MTKIREPLTYHHTLTNVAALIGWDQCAAICGVSTRTCRAWSDHDATTEIRMLDAERLDRAFLDAGGDHAPFHRLFTLRLELAAVAGNDACGVQLAAAAAKETGEAVSALMLATVNGSPDQIRHAKREGEEAINAIMRAVAHCDRQGN